jgi:hypothetical protein
MCFTSSRPTTFPSSAGLILDRTIEQEMQQYISNNWDGDSSEAPTYGQPIISTTRNSNDDESEDSESEDDRRLIVKRSPSNHSCFSSLTSEAGLHVQIILLLCDWLSFV